MLGELLKFFPESAYPLILAHDPDSLLNEESVLAALNERRFTLIYETDPIRLRYRVETVKPITIKQPIIIRTEKQLNRLPYDLWQQGHHVSLGLNTFFPNLSYSVLQQLSPSQIWCLSQAQSSDERLGSRRTIRFVLKHVFDLDLTIMTSAGDWVIWLHTYHQTWTSTPDLIIEFILSHLGEYFESLHLRELILSKVSFYKFLQEQWRMFIESTGEQCMREKLIDYILDFENSPKLQNHIGNIFSKGVLTPINVHEPQRFPLWAQLGIFTSNEDLIKYRLNDLWDVLISVSESELASYRWEQWQKLAEIWAEYNALSRVQSFGNSEENALSKRINKAFITWLQNHFSALATNVLPTPHHLFHVPHYMAYQRRKEKLEKNALIIIDGMALADWHLISTTWQERNPTWHLNEKLVLAQIPTITAISRQALVSGLRPSDFAETLRNNQAEPKHWRTFWQNEDVVLENCIYKRHDPRVTVDWIDSPHLEIVCLIDNSIDEIIHNTTLGYREFIASLRIWIDKDSRALEESINKLLLKGFTVYLTSDHGHIEASGFGKISEGLAAYTRSKRARVYNDVNLAEQNRQKVAPSFVWTNDGLLPNNSYVLVPEEQNAFVPIEEIVIAHGGLSISEVIVPLVTIGLNI